MPVAMYLRDLVRMTLVFAFFVLSKYFHGNYMFATYQKMWIA